MNMDKNANNKNAKMISNSILKEAYNKNKEKALSESGIDRDKVFEDLDNLIDDLAAKKRNEERIVVTKKKKKNGFFIPSISIVACGLLFAVLITSGIMNSMEPQIKDMISGSQATNIENGSTIDTKNPEDNQHSSTKNSIEYYDENDISNVQMGKIVLSGGIEAVLDDENKKGNYINPTKVTLKKNDINKKTCTWVIKKYETDKPLYKGKGLIVKNELTKMIEKEQDGNYIITYTYEDKAGNSFSSHKGFEIYTQND